MDNKLKQKLENFNWKKERLDILLVELFETFADKDTLNSLFSFMQKILVCFHGNAAVERSFSLNKNFLVENLEEKSLVAQRHLHDHIYRLEGMLHNTVLLYFISFYNIYITL